MCIYYMENLQTSFRLKFGWFWSLTQKDPGWISSSTVEQDWRNTTMDFGVLLRSPSRGGKWLIIVVKKPMSLGFPHVVTRQSSNPLYMKKKPAWRPSSHGGQFPWRVFWNITSCPHYFSRGASQWSTWSIREFKLRSCATRCCWPCGAAQPAWW